MEFSNFPNLGHDLTLKLRSRRTAVGDQHVSFIETVTKSSNRILISCKFNEMRQFMCFGIFAKFQGQRVKTKFLAHRP